MSPPYAGYQLDYQYLRLGAQDLRSIDPDLTTLRDKLSEIPPDVLSKDFGVGDGRAGSLSFGHAEELYKAYEKLLSTIGDTLTGIVDAVETAAKALDEAAKRYQLQEEANKQALRDAAKD